MSLLLHADVHWWAHGAANIIVALSWNHVAWIRCFHATVACHGTCAEYLMLRCSTHFCNNLWCERATRWSAGVACVPTVRKGSVEDACLAVMVI